MLTKIPTVVVPIYTVNQDQNIDISEKPAFEISPPALLRKQKTHLLRYPNLETCL